MGSQNKINDAHVISEITISSKRVLIFQQSHGRKSTKDLVLCVRRSIDSITASSLSKSERQFRSTYNDGEDRRTSVYSDGSPQTVKCIERWPLQTAAP